MLLQKSLQLQISFRGEGFLVFEHFEQGHDDGRRVELEDVLEDEAGVGHHGADFEAADLFPADPAEQIDLLEPAVEHVQDQVGLVGGHDGGVEAVVPEEGAGEDESGRGEGEAVVVLVRDDGVLGVELPLVEGDSSQQVVDGVLDEGLV